MAPFARGAPLTADEVEEIRRMRRDGQSTHSIGRRFAVSRMTVARYAPTPRPAPVAKPRATRMRVAAVTTARAMVVFTPAVPRATPLWLAVRRDALSRSDPVR